MAELSAVPVTFALVFTTVAVLSTVAPVVGVDAEAVNDFPAVRAVNVNSPAAAPTAAVTVALAGPFASKAAIILSRIADKPPSAPVTV